MEMKDIIIPARDGYSLTGTVFQPDRNPTQTVILINAATAVPQRYYKHFATYCAEQGYTAVTYDYRGIGQSKPKQLRGFAATSRDWTLQDMAGVVDWVQASYQPQRLFMIGHSYGGQMPGILPNADAIDAMITLAAQSGYWGLQGGNRKYSAVFHIYITIPLLCRLYGYMPWSKFGSAEDLPKGAALEWAQWCRYPDYFLEDPTLPLDRYQAFQTPVLAYSFDDDNWGTAPSVDAMMKVYSSLTRRHIVPAEVGLDSIKHFGFFRPKAKGIWQEAIDWLEAAVPSAQQHPA